MDVQSTSSSIAICAHVAGRPFVCLIVRADGVRDISTTAHKHSTRRRRLPDVSLSHFDKLIAVLSSSAAYRSALLCRVFSPTFHAVHLRSTVEGIDMRFNAHIKALLNGHIEVQEQMWWLSTLGGAYSSMGDYETRFAMTAGNLSRIQHAIAAHLDDPILQARCRLYLALAFSQCGRLREAKRIVRLQHRLSIEVRSELLRNCSLGVWSRLQAVHRRERMVIKQ